MAKFHFVSVSKDDNFSFSNDEMLESSNKLGFTHERFQSNKDPLTVLYNRCLEKERENRTNDFLVFFHADVKFDIEHLIRRCEEVSEKYDVIGLCGTKKVMTSQSPLNWFTSSIPCPNQRIGFVSHGELGNRDSFFNQDRPEIEDSSVGCIDGLCIIFGKRALDSDLKFDERFLYDMYDTDLSFETLINHKLNLGVIVEKSLKHFSVGKSILTKDFLLHEIYFRKKWNLEIPENSPMKRLIQQKQEVQLI